MKRSLLHKADKNSHFIWHHSTTAWAEGASKCLRLVSNKDNFYLNLFVTDFMP